MASQGRALLDDEPVDQLAQDVHPLGRGRGDLSSRGFSRRCPNQSMTGLDTPRYRLCEVGVLLIQGEGRRTWVCKRGPCGGWRSHMRVCAGYAGGVLLVLNHGCAEVSLLDL